MEYNLNYLFRRIAGRILFTLLIFLCFLTNLQASGGQGRFKNMKETKVTLYFTNAPLLEFIRKVEAETPFRFTFDEQDALYKIPISVRARNESLDKVLARVSSSTRLEFKQVNNNIHVRLRDFTGQGPSVTSEGFSAIDITGKVTNDKGEGLPGVTILEKGTTNGTATDVNGSFSINTVNSNPVLVISYVGFQTQEVVVNSQTVFSITLKEDIKALEEVVVIGYGAVERKDLTGSVSSVSAKDIKDLPVARIDQALLGKVPGVQVIPITGEPGAAPQIRIRGVGSISAGSGPLYVVDGFPIDNIQSLNPNDIESMDILKDASATAIYGSRGANGVIIINTKRGKAGKTKISFDTYTGWQQVMKRPQFLNAREQAQYYYDGIRNRNIDNDYDVSGPHENWTLKVPQTPLDVLSGKNTYDVDALDAVLRTAPQSQYQLSAAGGTEMVRFALSGEYLNQEGIILNSDFNRYSLRGNIDARLTKKLMVKMNMNASMTDSRSITASGGGGGENEGVIAQAGSAMPYYPLFNPDGSYFVYNNIDASTVLLNPVAVANEINARQKRVRMLANVTGEYSFTDNLKLNVMVGATTEYLKGMKFRPSLPAFFGGPAVGSDNTSNMLNWITETTLNYVKSFGKHNITGLAGFTSQKENFQTNSLNSNRYPNNLVPTLSAVSGILTGGSSDEGEWSLVSYLGRFNYNYNSKYYLTASIRTDGSSRFGSENKYGLFPSAAVAWRISDENFLKDVRFLNELKLRGTYGETGNNNIGNYEHFATITYERYILGGAQVGGYAPGKLANPNLTWEKQKSMNFGADASFFNRRITVTLDHFRSRNTDLLLNVNVPDITGFSTALKNIGEVKNTGWEFVLGTVNLDGKFNWTTDINFSTYKNKVVKLGPTGDPIISNTNITRIGQPIGMFYGFLTDGIFRNQAEIEAGPIFSPGGIDRSRPGDIRFKDVSGPNGTPDGIINNYDNTIMGSPYPDFYYGVTNNFSYKGLTLSVSLQGSQGNEVFSTANNIRLLTRSRSRTLDTQRNYWKSEQDPGDGVTPRPNDQPTGGIRLNSQRYIESGSYLRINNIVLGYSLPVTLVEKIRLSSLRFYVTANNPFIFTKNTSFNPEVSNSASALNPGIDLNNYPLPKSLIIGVNIGF
ncbi:SusC/RagA family TonB-linked outer membrane protein [Dyadobacter bucti]|uniref:SusC/RagA family TonB-linked outer membrane protein n=1 Tax=Dyadobacter bucti TaxID=2572203 RepID=UPI001107FC87|nr:TonB-dependent receptor [Dyadobacter bucti]